VNCTIDNCVIDSITDNGVHAMIFAQNHDYSANCTVRFTNNIVRNIRANSENTSQGAAFFLRSHRWTGSNNTYTNISAPNNQGFRGAVYGVDNQAYTSLTLTNDSFTDITNRNDGGAIHTNCPRNFTLSSCSFENCQATNGRGGAIFINSSGIFTYLYCRFYNNSASVANGGNDVGHNMDIYVLYTSSNFVVTCSNSAGIKVAFPDGQNLNNLLLGVFIFRIVYFGHLYLFIFQTCRMYS
jgi:hypothetical protein